MCKTILFRIIYSRKKITELFIAPLKACHYVELEPVEIENTNTSTAFLKKDKYLDNEKFLVSLSDLMSEFIFSELKVFFATPFSKRLISKYS